MSKKYRHFSVANERAHVAREQLLPLDPEHIHRQHEERTSSVFFSLSLYLKLEKNFSFFSFFFHARFVVLEPLCIVSIHRIISLEWSLETLSPAYLVVCKLEHHVSLFLFFSVCCIEFFSYLFLKHYFFSIWHFTKMKKIVSIYDDF